jgi:hypothetical protein
MVSKSLIASIFFLCFTTSVDAHALIAPALGVNGNGARSDVQNPSAAKPCGNVNIAQTLDTSTALPLSQNGSFSTSITDFNGGADGSRNIQSVKVDPSGTGNNFVAATMLVNGDPNPTTVGTDQLSVQLPPGTKCTGGKSNDLCLVSFVTTAGFGNCVVVSQGSTTPANNAKGQQQNKTSKDNSTTGNNTTGNNTTGNNTTGNNNTGNGTTSDNTTGKNNTGNNKTGNNTTGNNNTGDNKTGKNTTDTSTGDKNKKCTKANRRSASFKRNWSSRELVDVLQLE